MKPGALRVTVIFLAMACLLVAALAVLTRQAVRQERLNRALIAAVKRDDDKAVASLLQYGADANAEDETPRKRSVWQFLLDRLQGESLPRHYASSPLLVALSSHVDDRHSYGAYLPENVTLVRSLLDHGARIDERFGAGEPTPLMWAVMSGKHATIHLLLEHRADVNAQESDHSTALTYAVWRSDEETVGALLAHRANVNVRQDPLGTALGMAQDSEHEVPNATTEQIVRILKQAGARP
jgi:ankyrin repeat protein